MSRPVADALRSIAPASVRTGARCIDAGDIDRLHDAERSLLGACVESRRREFATGRVLLRSLTRTSGPILVSPNRAPAAPIGWCCSLAHDGSIAAAAASDDPLVRAVGVDLEKAGAVRDTEADVVVRPDEAGLDPTLAFVLKEAAYKAWSASGGQIVGHHDVRVEVAGDAFCADFGGVRRIGGRYRLADETWWCALAVLTDSGTVPP